MKLGACTLIEKIAEGSLAEIYLAKAPTTAGDEKCLVCKCVRPAVAGDSEFYDSIMVELECAGPLRHPNIVTIFNFCVDNGNAFLTMEYLDAKDLRYLVNTLRAKNQNLPYPMAIYILSQIAKGLHAVHELKDGMGIPKQIVHRDVTPENIFFNSEGMVKIGDFGIAKAAGRLTATPPDIIRGKFNYLSPEQAWCDTLDRRSDIYAMAIIFYEAVLGVPFYRSNDINQLITEARCGLHVAPIRINPTFPPELNAIIEKATDIDKSQRYQTALEFRAALLDFAHKNHCEVTRQEWLSFLEANVPIKRAPLSLMGADEMAPDPSIFICPELSEETFEDESDFPPAEPVARHDPMPVQPYPSPDFKTTPVERPRAFQSAPGMNAFSPLSATSPLSIPAGMSFHTGMPVSAPPGTRPTPGTPLPVPGYGQSSGSADSFRSVSTIPVADAEQFKDLFPQKADRADMSSSATALAIAAMPEDDDELDNIPTSCSDVISTVPENGLADDYLLTNDFGLPPDLIDGNGSDTIPMEAPTPELLDALAQQFRSQANAQLPADPKSINETVPLIITDDYKDILKKQQSAARPSEPAKQPLRRPPSTDEFGFDEETGIQIVKHGHVQPQVIILIFLIVLIAGMLGFLLAMLVLRK